MGTNYYYKTKCEHCGHIEELHIGKSSAGWCFSLHIIPEKGINTLDDWVNFMKFDFGDIYDSYNNAITLPELLDIIRDRDWVDDIKEKIDSLWLRENSAVEGPRNLIRAEIGGRCVGHGDGTWDLIIGDFS